MVQVVNALNIIVVNWCWHSCKARTISLRKTTKNSQSTTTYIVHFLSSSYSHSRIDLRRPSPRHKRSLPPLAIFKQCLVRFQRLRHNLQRIIILNHFQQLSFLYPTFVKRYRRNEQRLNEAKVYLIKKKLIQLEVRLFRYWTGKPALIKKSSLAPVLPTCGSPSRTIIARV